MAYSSVLRSCARWIQTWEACILQTVHQLEDSAERQLIWFSHADVLNSIMAYDLSGALCACLSLVLSIHKVAGLLRLGSTADVHTHAMPLMAVRLLSLPQQIPSGDFTAYIIPCNMSCDYLRHSKYSFLACESIPVMYAGTLWAPALQA